MCYNVDSYILEVRLMATLTSEIERKKNDITEAIAQDPAEAARLLTTYIRE